MNNSKVELHGIHSVAHQGPLASQTQQSLELIWGLDPLVCIARMDLVLNVKMMQDIRLGGADLWTFAALEGVPGVLLADVLGQHVPVEEFVAVAALHLTNVAKTRAARSRWHAAGAVSVTGDMACEVCSLVQWERLSAQSALIHETFVDGGVLVRMLFPVLPHHTLVRCTVPGGSTELAGVFPNERRIKQRIRGSG